MDQIALGRTGLTVSAAGLGCGGSSRLGLGRGKSQDHAVRLVHSAYDQGVTIFDTAQAYGTEAIIGRALSSLPRHKVVISSKFQPVRGGALMGEGEIVAALERSLSALRSEYVDVFHIHMLSVHNYDDAVERIVPVLARERDKGKIRFIGVTESGPRDPEHQMLSRAVPDGTFAVVALALNMMNQTALRAILPTCRQMGIGSLIMFAVRAVFSKPERLAQEIDRCVREGTLPAWMGEAANPLDFLLHPDGADSIIDAAYRYVRHKSTTDVILFGTGDMAHLERNIASLSKPPLPAADIARLDELFSHLVGFGVDPPDAPSRDTASP